MSLFAIGDLHLPGGDDKPMNVFGSHWDGHFERICADWRERVRTDDTVLLPGDLSWAMQLEHATPDLRAVGELPGYKVILRGNHDYWWSTLTRVRAALPENMYAVQNDAFVCGEAVICGSRGWNIPTAGHPLESEDDRILRRELLRLEMSLQAAVRLSDGRPIVVMTHFPPLFEAERDTPFTALLERYPVHTAVYAHLHGNGIRAGFNGIRNGIRYRLASCDALGFRLARILPPENEEK